MKVKILNTGKADLKIDDYYLKPNFMVEVDENIYKILEHRSDIKRVDEPKASKKEKKEK